MTQTKATHVVIPMPIRASIEKMAALENRTLSNMLVTLLIEALESRENKKR